MSSKKKIDLSNNNIIASVENKVKRPSAKITRKSTAEQLEHMNLARKSVNPLSVENDTINLEIINPVHNDYKFLFLLFFLSNLWSVLFTFLPVIIEIPPDNIYSKHKGNLYDK